MLVAFTCVLFCFFFVLSFYGFGSLLNTRLQASIGVIPTVAIGMAFYILIGGVLNFLGFSYGWVSLVVLASGAVLGGITCIRKAGVLDASIVGSRDFWPVMGIVFLCLVLIVYLFSFVAFPTVFNTYDDFQKYFLHPTKMLETGSVFGSPISTVGKEVLGGQGFLQLPFVYLFGLKAINVFDAALCLFLICAAVFEQALKAAQVAVGLALILFIVLFNAQYVNVSALYSAAFLMTSALIIVCRIATNACTSDIKLLSFSVALVFASMLTLKISFVLFALVIFFSWAAVVHLKGYGFRSSIVALLGAAVVIAFALIPWMQTLWEYFSQLQHHSAHEKGLQFELKNWALMFQTVENYYGAVPIFYSLTALSGVIFGAVLLRAKKRDGAALIVVAAMSAVFIIYVFVMCVMGPKFLGSTTALRYVSPFLLGTIPIMVILGMGNINNSVLRRLTILALLLLSVTHIPFNLRMFDQYLDCGHRLPFPSALFCTDNMASYNETVLNGSFSAKVQSWQKHVPEGEPLWAWVATPFLFDFSRNKIYEVDSNGLSNPWRHIPHDAMYFIVQRSGVGFSSIEEWEYRVRTGDLFDAGIATNVLVFFNSVAEMPKQLIYQSDEVLIFKQID